MTISWILTRDAWPDGQWTNRDLTALDGDQVIGRVFQIEHGPDEGLWRWTVFPGGRFPHPTSGRERERGKAGRRVIETYRLLMQANSRGAA